MPATGRVTTIVVGRRARAETQRRETATRTPPADATRGGVPPEALDGDDPKLSTLGASPPDFETGVAVPGEPTESEPDDPEPDEPALDPGLEPEATGDGAGADGVEDVAGGPTGGFGTAGAVTVGVAVVTAAVVTVGVVTVGAVTVGVVTVGRVTVVTVGSVGGSRASAGPTSVALVATATAKQRIHRALSIRRYNPHRPSKVTRLKS